jgi:hypothetical protein
MSSVEPLKDYGADQKESANVDHDFSGDILKPQVVQDHLKAHDRRMQNQAPQWAMAKAMYTTNYWKYIKGNSTSPTTTNSGSLNNWSDVEVNRMHPFVASYMSSLYPRAQRAIMTHDPATNGDPIKAALAANRWIASKKVNKRILKGIRQGLLYPGCGAKIGVDKGRGLSLDRVWLRIIPWWEILLDFDVNDEEDERFRGHIFYQVKEKVEEEYGLKGLLTGTRREDFLERQELGKQNKGGNQEGYDTRPSSDSQAFVRVLELINLVDYIADPDDPKAVYRGRIEIYILDQGAMSNRPVYMGPIPFAETDGTPLPHIVPLIFNAEPEFPYRGIPHSTRLIPQMRELNSYRAWMAMSTRKDSRQWFYRKEAFTSDQLTSITEGEDGAMIPVEEGQTRPLNDIIAPFPQQPINSNVDRYMNYVEVDLERTMQMSPQARGEITKATAFEIQTVQQYTESEFGLHASIKDDWLAEIIKVFLRACIMGMQSTDSYIGADGDEDTQDSELLKVGGRPAESGEEDADGQAKEALLNEVQGKAAPFVHEDAVPPLGRHDKGKDTAIVQESLRLKDHRGEDITITVEDLSAEFEISFVEGGRTPLTDAAMQQNLVALMQPYMQLWEVAQQPVAQAVLARQYMQVMAERFDFPKDLYPDALEARLKEKEEAGEIQSPEEQAAQQQGQGAPAQNPPAPEDMEAMMQEILQLPPDQALQVLGKMLQGQPEALQALDQIAQIPDPAEQARMIQEFVMGLMQSAQQPQQPPPEGQA